MAEIPVERKGGGIPWWVWLLIAAIIVALLIWWASAEEDEVEVVDPVAIEQVEPLPADDVTMNQMTAGPITDMSMLMPTISEDMVGRQVQLDGVQVQEVVGDIGFWIGPSNEQRVFAVLSQEPTPTTPTEGEADVNPGATADISGTIRTRGEILEDMAQGQVADLPQGVDRFLVVDSYRINAPN